MSSKSQTHLVNGLILPVCTRILCGSVLRLLVNDSQVVPKNRESYTKGVAPSGLSNFLKSVIFCLDLPPNSSPQSTVKTSSDLML